jgi:hypothetical protein
MTGRRTTGIAAALALACAACGREAATRIPSSAAAVHHPAATAPAAGDSLDFARWVLRADGVGPVRVGMTLAEVDRLLPGGLADTTDLDPECDYVEFRNGPPGVELMTHADTVVRVDVDDSARVTTALGAHPGDPEDRIRALYPGARMEPNHYDEDGHYFVVIPGAPSDTLHRIVFETDGSVVTTLRSGLFPAVEYVEGCE